MSQAVFARAVPACLVLLRRLVAALALPAGTVLLGACAPLSTPVSAARSSPPAASPPLRTAAVAPVRIPVSVEAPAPAADAAMRSTAGRSAPDSDGIRRLVGDLVTVQIIENTAAGPAADLHIQRFAGPVPGVVTRVLPNGHLLIAGEKQVDLATTVEVLRFSGQVDPGTIRQGNTVLSTAMANVRVEQPGRGAVADQISIGWLSRFFLNLSPA